MSRTWSIVSLVIAISCAACGGGGGGEDKPTTQTPKPSVAPTSGPMASVSPSPTPSPTFNPTPTPTPTAEARTALVCPGLESDPCYEINTSKVAGVPLVDYVIKKPGAIFTDVASRRLELKQLPAKTVDYYCSSDPASAALVSPISYSKARVVLREYVDGQTGDKFADAAEVVIDSASIDSVALPSSTGFVFIKNVGSEVLTLGVGKENFPELDQTFWFFVEAAPLSFREQRNTDRKILFDLPQEKRRAILSMTSNLSTILESAEYSTDAAASFSLWTPADVKRLASDFSGYVYKYPETVAHKTLECHVKEPMPDFRCFEGPDMEFFRDTLIDLVGDYIGMDRQSSGQAAYGEISRWAAAQALTENVDLDVNNPSARDYYQRYELTLFLISVVNSYSLLKDESFADANTNVLIEAWLDQLIEYASSPNGYDASLSDHFNVGYLKASLKMAWGAVTGKDNLFQDGVEKIWVSLHQIRPDGSFPRESSRGACALFYSSVATTSVIMMAEIAENQGYPAYSFSVDGKSLHDMVGFVASASNDLSIIQQYSVQAPGNCSIPYTAESYDGTIDTDPVRRVDSTGRTSNILHGETESAWLEFYLRRFPGNANSNLVRNIMEAGLTQGRPLVHPSIGGNSSCLAAMD